MSVTRAFFLLSVLALLCVGLGLPVRAQDATPTPSPTPIPRPLPQQSVTDGRSTLELYFANLPQGGTGLLRVHSAEVSAVRVRFLDTVSDFYSTDDGFYVLIPIGLDVTPRDYPLSVSVLYADGARGSLEARVSVTLGGFLRQSFTIPPERAYLTAPEVERTEYARIESLLTQPTEQRLWDASGFRTPLNAEVTSAFGSFRTLNDFAQTRHTGWDFRAAPGTPVQASASGVIAYAAPLDIRGNYVLVNHGFGIFSGYAHLEQILVSEGQTVGAGQIIGMSGNTGRSNGPHLHWEIAVNGQWIDSLAFTQMWLP